MTIDLSYEQPSDEEVLPTLRSGLRWLYRSPQPDDAIVSHHGFYMPPLTTRRYGFIPRGYHGDPVVTVDVLAPRRHDNAPPANPLAPDELRDIVRVLNTLGVDTVSTWNGHPGVTGSVRLAAPCHPTLAEAVDRYRAGCVTHPRLYSGKPEGDVFCQCGWYAEGVARLIKPAAPEPSLLHVTR